MRPIFSPNEQMVLDILGRKKMKITEITLETGFVHDAGNRTALIIRKINSKCVRYRLPWRLEGSGLGRHGRTVWRATVKT